MLKQLISLTTPEGQPGIGLCVLVLQHGIYPVTGTGQRHIPEPVVFGSITRCILQNRLLMQILVIDCNHPGLFQDVVLFRRRQGKIQIAFIHIKSSICSQ